MAPFQLFLCTLMVVAIVVSLTVYVLRMRRASHLVERIVAGSAREEGARVAATEGSATPAPGIAPSEPPKGLLPIERKKLCPLRVARIYPETPDIKTQAPLESLLIQSSTTKTTIPEAKMYLGDDCSTQVEETAPTKL